MLSTPSSSEWNGKEARITMDILICPICGEKLLDTGASLVCESPKKHCFDKAKSGYVNLTVGKSGSGDDRDMVKARTEFLNRGYYLPLAEAVADLVGGCDTVIDCGCGDGYYSITAAKKCRRLCGFDLSKHACERGAKRAKDAGVNCFFGVASVFSLPIEDGAADAAISLFAPIAEKEFSRILKAGAKLIVVGAGKRHLYEFKEAMYADVYENEGRRDLPVDFTEVESRNLRYSFKCDGGDLRKLLMMTPYAFKTSVKDAAKLDSLDFLEITADFDIFIYEKN